MYVLPTECIYLLGIAEQTAVISLYTTDWFLQQRRRVFTAWCDLNLHIRILVNFLL